MNRFLPLAALALVLSGCSLVDRPSSESALDAQIASTVEAVRQNPDSAALHNELGALLMQKGFPKDAEREFERAINADSRAELLAL